MLRFMKTTPLALLGLTALSLGACTVQTTVVSDFDPTGIAVDLEASWTINGAPADQISCDEAGISTVQLVFVDDTFEYRDPLFTFDCGLGAVLVESVLQRGTFSAFWESQDASGNALQQSGVITVDANNAEDVARPDIPDFTATAVVENDALLTVSWDTDIATDIVATDCANIEGVDFVAYALFDDVNDTLIKDYMWSAGCADQITIPEEDLVVGTEYRVEIDGGPEEGLSYWQATCFFTAQEGGTTASCEAADVRYRLAVDLVWDSNEGATFSAADCAGAGVEFMNYELRPEGGSAILSETQVACGDAIIFEEPAVTQGETYELTIIGHDDNTFGGEWTLLCVGLTAGSGVMENGACEIERG